VLGKECHHEPISQGPGSAAALARDQIRVAIDLVQQAAERRDIRIDFKDWLGQLVRSGNSAEGSRHER
jgi:hypothetical protein